MARIAIVVGHERIDTYCEALAESYARGARDAGHQACIFVTSKLSFDPRLLENYRRAQLLEPDLRRAHDCIMHADHLVFICPLLMGAFPGLFQSFLERVFQPDLVAASKQSHFGKPLKGKSARVVITMGMPSAAYRWWFGAHALKALRRNVLRFLGVNPIHASLFGNVEGVGLQGRRQWLQEMEELGRAAA